MAILNRKERVSDEIPTASMADIAFLLLVFFLTTTVFNEEKGLPIVLPEQAEEQEVSAKNLLFLIVRPDGSVVVRRGESEQEQVVSYREVDLILRQELAANPNLRPSRSGTRCSSSAAAIRPLTRPASLGAWAPT